MGIPRGHRDKEFPYMDRRGGYDFAARIKFYINFRNRGIEHSGGRVDGGKRLGHTVKFRVTPSLRRRGPIQMAKKNNLPSDFTKKLSSFSVSLRRSQSPTENEGADATAAPPAEEEEPKEPLTPETQWQCSKCKQLVHVGLAGHSNMVEHWPSKKCKDGQAKLKKEAQDKSKRDFMKGFFKKAPAIVPPTVAAPPPVHPFVASRSPPRAVSPCERSSSPELNPVPPRPVATNGSIDAVAPLPD
ncbi:hypothetical protein C8R47DRAFT_1071211 [Mycena vitilis]|nr:hypothetical protein C8R47DRAFT_1071211 [Mycena vitilis]